MACVWLHSFLPISPLMFRRLACTTRSAQLPPQLSITRYTTRATRLQSVPCAIHVTPCYRMSTGTSSQQPQPLPETRVQASIQVYDRHILIASETPYQEWKKRLEDVESNPARELTTAESIYNHFIDAIKAKQFTSNSPLQPQHTLVPIKPITTCPRLTLFDISPPESATWTGPSTKTNTPSNPFKETDLLVFSQTEPPNHISLASPSSTTVKVEDLRTNTPIDTRYQPELQRILCILGQPATATASNPLPSNSSEPQHEYQLYAFVCCHSQRDERCGQRGPVIVDAIRAYTKKLKASSSSTVNIRAFPCSHVGGHEFAANVLLYGFKSQSSVNEPTTSITSVTPPVVNDWFGLVAPEQVSTLLDSYTSYLQRIFSTTSSGDLDATQRREAHLDLLRQSLLTSSSTSNSCASCSCDSSTAGDASSTKLTSSAVTTLGHLWRGSMGIDRPEARTIVKKLSP